MPSIKTFFFYGVSAAALLALADPFPKLAIVFTLILIAGVLLTHWQDFTPYFSPPHGGKFGG